MNNLERFIVQSSLGDGKPGYWHSGEWYADRDKAKVYKVRAYADRVAQEYGGEVICLTSKLRNETIYAYDVLCLIKQLRQRAKGEAGWKHPDYVTYHKGTQHAYGEAVKLLEELLEPLGIDIEAELGFVL